MRNKEEKCSNRFVFICDLENCLHFTEGETKAYFIEMCLGRNDPFTILDVIT